MRSLSLLLTPKQILENRGSVFHPTVLSGVSNSMGSYDELMFFQRVRKANRQKSANLNLYGKKVNDTDARIGYIGYRPGLP